MKLSTTMKLIAATVFASGLGVGLGSTALAAEVVNVGLSTALTGRVASLGQSNKNGVELAIKKINADGGLLGKQIKLLTADDEAKPALGATNVRSFILTDKIKAIFGPVSSAVGTAEGMIAAQYHVPIFFSLSNDVDQTGKYFSKYAFQVVPDTYTEARSVAEYVAKRSESSHWKTYYTMSFDYSFGRSTVAEFLQGVKQSNVAIDLVGQQWSAEGTSDFSQNIAAILAKKPDFLFLPLYGSDLITFTKQAEGAGLFKNMAVYGGYEEDTLQALGRDAPSGAISTSRAVPFYYGDSKELKDFTQAYYTEFHSWPTSWAITGYSAVETWAEGVRKAGSFDADKVVAALSGATIEGGLRGSFTLRECDHQADVPEYIGIISKDFNTKYGIHPLIDIEEIPTQHLMMSCKDKQALRGQ